MTEYAAPLLDIKFISSQLTDLDTICQFEAFSEASPELASAIFDEAAKFAEGVLSPLNVVGDREGCRQEGGSVTTATGWKEAYRQFAEAGWVGLTMPPCYGGQGLPKLISAPVVEMWFGANMAFSLLAPMAGGATETLMHAASENLKEIYIPKLVSGEWTAAMDLTEPGSGSDLGAIRTRAERQPDGTYRLFGQKIFITYGDHDLAGNIVHLVLARIPYAPPGARGISMFLVPKFLQGMDGSTQTRNDIHCASLEHKLGIHGSPTCVMAFGEQIGAVGYLVGEPGRGLEHMFVMVNDSRFNVGLQGVGLGERAYQKAALHAGTRIQGRDAVSGEPNVPIIRHPDVRGMLLTMRSRVLASRILAICAAGWSDFGKYHPDAATAARYRGLVDLMMPVVKGWITEQAFEVANIGIQVQGGMGFVEETGAAQYLRDVRITTIYEGTTGIQANDLIGRKVRRDDARALNDLIADMRQTAKVASGTSKSELGQELEEAITSLEGARDWILATNTDQTDLLSGSVSFLNLLGVVSGAWQMVRASLAASDPAASGFSSEYLQEIADLADFYFAQVLPQVPMHAAMMRRAGRVVRRSMPA